MLTQVDIVNLLAKDANIPQHIAFQYLSAYVYCKSSRGNLPSEVLAKVISIQRKLITKHGPVPSNSTIGRAFDAMKSQLLNVNKRWLSQGVAAWGQLGYIGAASNLDARWAWTKATDGKVKEFPKEATVEVDAGRIQPAQWGGIGGVGLGMGGNEPQTPGVDDLPEYAPPPPGESANQDDETRRADSSTPDSQTQAQDNERRYTRPDGTPMSPEEIEIERGRERLARLREERERVEREREATEAARREDERRAAAELADLAGNTRTVAT